MKDKHGLWWTILPTGDRAALLEIAGYTPKWCDLTAQWERVPEFVKSKLLRIGWEFAVVTPEPQDREPILTRWFKCPRCSARLKFGLGAPMLRWPKSFPHPTDMPEVQCTVQMVPDGAVDFEGWKFWIEDTIIY